MDALEQAWFARADRDSVVADELEALDERPEPDFTRLKIALGCMLAALAMLVMPLFKPSPQLVAPPIAKVPVAAKRAPVAVAVVAPTKPQLKTKVKAVKSKRVPGKLVARK